MARPAKQPIADGKDGVAGCFAICHLRRRQRVPETGVQVSGWRNLAREFKTAGFRFTNVEVLGAKRIEAQRARGNDVAIVIVEPRQVEFDPIVGEPLLDAGIDGARTFRLEIRITEKEVVTAE
jgi:hypothetical protein